MEKRGSKLTIILVVAIVVLVALSGYFIYSDNQSKQEIDILTLELSDVRAQFKQVSDDKKELDSKYDLLVKDVAEIYRTCMNDNACKGRYPNVSWYCNNVGDEADNYSHVCKCDASCNLVATAI